MSNPATAPSRAWRITTKVFVAASGLFIGLIGGVIIGLLTGLIEIRC